MNNPNNRLKPLIERARLDAAPAIDASSMVLARIRDERRDEDAAFFWFAVSGACAAAAVMVYTLLFIDSAFNPLGALFQVQPLLIG